MGIRPMRNKNLGFWFTLPATLYMTLFFVVPLIIIFIYSFMKSDPSGGVTASFSLDAYKTLFQPAYGRTLLNTLYISLISVGAALAIALPCAYYMVQSTKKTLLLFIIIIPFWTNFLVRIFAWKAILEANGFLNLILLKLHIISEPIIFLYNPAAVIIVLAYTYLPLMILPLYSTIDKFDFALLDAARDLGCTQRQALVKVMLPAIRSGIYTALIFAFIPIFGQYVIPELIGGGRDGTFMLGQRIANAFFRERNWSVPSAFATLMTAIMLLVMLVYKIRITFNKKLKKGSKAS
jgi:spermidine/putrescine transport system permease protein